MKKIVAFFVLVAIVFHSGCNLLGIIAVLGTPSSHEKKVTADYGLADRKDQKILVLVNQGVWLNADVNLRYYLTEAVNENLLNKVKIGPNYLISYSKLAEIRSKQPDLAQLSPVELAAALDADMVLLVEIDAFSLNELPEDGYYKGYLNARAVLLETATTMKLWPKSEKSKVIKVGFDVEPQGKEAAVDRLASASAYGIVRYLYNCPRNKFKFADDRSGTQWQEWE
jgi:hypothetical protein